MQVSVSGEGFTPTAATNSNRKKRSLGDSIGEILRVVSGEFDKPSLLS